jgi:hypothetical protein
MGLPWVTAEETYSGSVSGNWRRIYITSIDHLECCSMRVASGWSLCSLPCVYFAELSQ